MVTFFFGMATMLLKICRFLTDQNMFLWKLGIYFRKQLDWSFLTNQLVKLS